MKRFHEAPLCIFNEVQHYTGGDYALVHLLKHDKYRLAFECAIENGREVILDNSLYELGTAFNGDQYVNWINRLQPRWFIVPDAWHDSAKTIEMFDQFEDAYRDKIDYSVQWIGVAQGKTVAEVKASYRALEPRCDMIAFNFDFKDFFRSMTGITHDSDRLDMSFGRILMLNILEQQGVINRNKRHHLLGCGFPGEYKIAKEKFPWVYSMDTCHPVITGYAGFTYDGNDKFCMKSNIKMESIMLNDLTDLQRANIYKNLEDKIWE